MAYMPFHQQIEEIERFAEELHRLITSDEPALNRRGMRDEARGLCGWVESYRRGLHHGLLDEPGETTDEFRHDNAWLAGVGDRLKLESDAMMGVGDYGEMSADAAAEDPMQRHEVTHFVERARSISHTPQRREARQF